ENYVSAKGLKKMSKKLYGRSLKPPEILKKAENNDPIAIKIWNNFGKDLGVSLSYVVNILDPEIIILGGSISNAYKFFINSLKKYLIKNINSEPAKRLKVIPGELGEYGGLIGAASLDF
ncbi:hypothetical protein DRQ09_09835, partial [candidate division KSB1 bacterium]